MIPPESFSLFAELIDDTENFMLTTHMNPDGDAVGSELGLAEFLVERGKQVRIVNHDPASPNLQFIENGVVEVEIYDPGRHAELLEQVERIVLLDNSAPDRLGGMEQPVCAQADRVLCIDHHPTRGNPWKHNVLDVDACATASLVYDLTCAQGWTPGPVAAQALFVGLATDTGFFRFNSTTPRAYEIAAALMRIGVDPARCYQLIYERNSAAYTRLLGHALLGLQLDAGGAVASVTLTDAQVIACHAADVDPSEMTTPLLAMDGVQIAILFRELDSQRVKVSLRSKGKLDVRGLAAEFGGGGHRNASGIVLEGRLDEASRRVIARAAALALG